VVGPVLVIVEPASTAKLTVVPRFTGGWAAILVAGTTSITTSASNGVSSNGIDRILLRVFIDLFILFPPDFSWTCIVHHLFTILLRINSNILGLHKSLWLTEPQQTLWGDGARRIADEGRRIRSRGVKASWGSRDLQTAIWMIDAFSADL
jgi:hypothetical protein